MSTRSASPSRGFTLIEAAISTVIVGTMVAAAVSVVGTAARGTNSERSIRHGQVLVRAMMSEVLSTGFSDPQGGSGCGVDSGEATTDRTTLDDVDDYCGLSEAWPTDHLGREIPWAESWKREVTVSNVAFDAPTTALADDVRTGLKLVTVKVTSPEGRVSSLTALKSNANPIDARPLAVGTGNYVRARFYLRVGEQGSLLVGGAELFNTPPSALAAAPVAVPVKPADEPPAEVKK